MADDESETLCDFCRLSCPLETVTMDYEGTTYEFCSEACRTAMAESDRVFTEFRGYRRFHPGVAGIDRHLPQGMLRNSFVLLSGQAGSRDDALHAELVWRTLQRGEPAVVVTFQEPPISVVESFLTMDWNVLPYVQRDQLHFVDCFTYRLDDPQRLYERMNDWNRHLRRVVKPATTDVRDASDVRELDNKIDRCLEARGMVDTGVVLIDSLTEFGSLVQPIRAYDFVKDLRADVCKGRFVPVFAGATLSGNGDGFPHDLDYTADGVVDMELNGGIVEDTLIKRIRVRKMNGVLAIPEWTAYEYTAGIGMVTFDPRAEIERTRDPEADGDGAGGGGPDAGDGDASGDRDAGDGDASGDRDADGDDEAVDEAG